MPTLDVFASDAFQVRSLIGAINKLPFVPGRVGRLGIFQADPVVSPLIQIEEYQGTLSLIPTSPRGGPGNQNLHNKRKMRSFTVPHLELDDNITAEEVSGIREFGTEDEVQSVMGEVNKRMMEMNKKHDATIEYQRIGAVKGIILDSDGSTTIYNLFTEFGVTQDTVDFVLGTTTTSILSKILEVKGYIEDELGEATYDHVHCFAGKTWFQKFITHTEVKEAYKYFQMNNQRVNPLREDLRYDGFEFGGVIFEQYRGKVGSVSFVADSEAHFFPVGGGANDIYKTVYAPADWVETVNTKGLPRYAKIIPDPSGKGKYVTVTTQSNPLCMCTRPKALIKGTTSN